ncbi:MAG: HAMP domain-containing protein [Anaerolineae bacterium]|nr:HAMP domain-containing protein [Anaerolineae bacterium]
MFKTLYWKLALAFVAVAFTTAALVAVFIRVTSASRLTQLIIDQQRSSMEQTLANYYTENGSWEGVASQWRELQHESSPAPAPPPEEPLPGENFLVRRDRRNLLGLADAQGIVIVSVERDYPEGSQLPADLLAQGDPIEVNNQRVGVILTASGLPNFNPEEALFLERTNRALMLGILGALLAALVMGILLARTLTNPLKALTKAAQSIAEGRLEQEVRVASHDEIGQLAAAFNRMSQEVARSNLLRRQMTADIAHDLRTPLTVIGGYVESMRDGVLQPTPQRFALIHTEIERLQKLVGDLRVLSQADAGELPLNPQRISPAALLERAIQLFQHQAAQQNIALSVETEAGMPEIWVDEDRMMQVMDNLLSNAFRYTPAGGKILVKAWNKNGRARIMVEDTGTGIDAEDLPFIFDRFRRADKSRHTESGESGLGLAIVKALVESHGGSVWAESKPSEGSAFFIELPFANTG